MAKWSVDVKGHAMARDWEISVVHERFPHGISSFGWFGDCKVLIGSSGGPCHNPAIKPVWDALLVVAQTVCDQLNAGAQTIGVDNT